MVKQIPGGPWLVPVRFLRLLIARFVADRGLSNAASLTYTTLLALVPLKSL